MDGIVPLIYIGLCIGGIVSICLTIIWLYCKAKTKKEKLNQLHRVAKINFFLVSILFTVLLLSQKTIIGYGFLMYVVPIQFIIGSSMIVVSKKPKN